MEKIVNFGGIIIYSSFFRFCAFRFLFLRKNPKNRKAKYISKLMPKIKTIFEISINDFFYKLQHFFQSFMYGNDFSFITITSFNY